MLGVVPTVAEHPLPTLLDAGVTCSLNADDPLLFGPGLLEEYELVRAELGLDDDRLAAIARSSIVASGADDAHKADASRAVDAWLASPYVLNGIHPKGVHLRAVDYAAHRCAHTACPDSVPSCELPGAMRRPRR